MQNQTLPQRPNVAITMEIFTDGSDQHFHHLHTLRFLPSLTEATAVPKAFYYTKPSSLITHLQEYNKDRLLILLELSLNFSC